MKGISKTALGLIVLVLGVASCGGSSRSLANSSGGGAGNPDAGAAGAGGAPSNVDGGRLVGPGGFGGANAAGGLGGNSSAAQGGSFSSSGGVVGANAGGNGAGAAAGRGGGNGALGGQAGSLSGTAGASGGAGGIIVMGSGGSADLGGQGGSPSSSGGAAGADLGGSSVVASGGNGGTASMGTGGVASTGGAGTGTGGAAPGTGGSGTGGDPGPSPQTELTPPAVSVQGGSAPSAGGLGQNGGTLHLVASGAIAIGPATMPTPPTIPSAPANATVVTTAALATDIATNGPLVVSDAVSSSGADAVRSITTTGDIFVSGTLRSADLGTGRQGLTLNASSGTVYVSGTIDTSGAAGSGQAGGALTIIASRVVVTGKLITSGGNGALAGVAGTVSLMTAQDLYLGAVSAVGGDSLAVPMARGGRGAIIKLQIGGDAVVAGPVLFRGGYASSTAADALGGAAGAFALDCDGLVTVAGTLDARGGTAIGAATGAPAGGAAGGIAIGETAPPKSIAILVPTLVTGGAGDARGGGGGTANLEPHTGNLSIAGSLDASGGDSGAIPGVGGNIFCSPGPDSGAMVTAGVDVSGQVSSDGGSIIAGRTGDGANGGVIKMVMVSSKGNIAVQASGQVRTNGGNAGTTGKGGDGGLAYLFTNDGNASIHGTLLARGGNGPGGVGGTGGLVYLFTDNNHGGPSGGTLTIETDGVIDASGGGGAQGGSARNDGRVGAVNLFPDVQDDEFTVSKIAVLLNSDGKHGTATGSVENKGHIVARGGATNGAGGDVVFHGKRPNGNETPLPGNIDRAADGTGVAGDFAAE